MVIGIRRNFLICVLEVFGLISFYFF